jgi:hypothetical protein
MDVESARLGIKSLRFQNGSFALGRRLCRFIRRRSIGAEIAGAGWDCVAAGRPA